MRKILRIATYDFKRLVLNPITLSVVGILLCACMIFSIFYKIPTTPEYKATIVGSTTQSVYDNFRNGNYADSKSNLLGIMNEAENYFKTIDKNQENLEYEELKEINSKFLNIYNKVENSLINDNNEYLTQGINEILENAKALDEFVKEQRTVEEFKSKIIFTKKQFAELEKINNSFQEILNPKHLSDLTKQSFSRKEIESILNKLHSEIKIFTSLSNLVENEIISIVFDEEKISQLKTKYVERSRAKLGLVEKEMNEINSSAIRGDTSYIQELQSLATTYKLICEGSKFSIINELKLLLQTHFGNLNNLHTYTPIQEEAIKTSLTQFNYFLDNENLYYEQYQNPLNFNIASYKETAFDSAYFVLSIIGFLAIIFGIFCAYKLFGRDRRNGKMDLLLSQDVRYSQVFAGKFLAIVFSTSAILGLFAIVSLIWALLFSSLLPGSILAVFNNSTAYLVSPFIFFILKLLGIEMQVIFYSVMTIFLMNITRRFELSFAIALVIFAAATIFNIFFHTSLIYCLFPFIHADLTSFLGGGIVNAGFLQTPLYSHGNFFISLTYYIVVVGLLYNFTNQLFKKN